MDHDTATRVAGRLLRAFLHFRRHPGGYLTAAIAAGATTFTFDHTAGGRHPTAGVGQNSEDVTVSSATGSGPYTVTLSAGTVNAHASGEKWGVAAERLRQ